MTEETNPTPVQVEILSEETEFRVTAGSTVEVPFYLLNKGDQPLNLGVTVEGIPAGWVSMQPTQNYIQAGERKLVRLFIRPSVPTETGPGTFPLTVQIINLEDRQELTSLELELTVAAIEVEGRINLLLESTEFTVAPGSSTLIQILMRNQGLVDDNFSLQVDGLPVSWLVTESPVVSLSAGEQRLVKLSIFPPAGSQSTAGSTPFTLRVISEEVQDQVAEVELTLVVTPFRATKLILEPEQLRGREGGLLKVQNLGNVDTSYEVSLHSDGDQVLFEPADPQEIQVPAGGTGELAFQANPAKRQFIGTDRSYPFSARAESAGGGIQTAEGVLIAEPRLPFWIVPVLLLLCLCVMVVTFIYYSSSTRAERAEATQTAALYQTETALVAPIVPTATLPAEGTPVSTETPLVGTPTAQETATAIPTATPLPTETPLPTATLPPPTNTPIQIPNVGIIAFQSNRDGDPELYAQNTADGAIARLTFSPGVDTQPAYSPDGSRIAFVSNRDNNNEIYLMNTDGSAFVNLTNNPAADQHPSWSSDGQFIVFSSNRDGVLDIYRMRPDGSEVVNLTNNPGADDQMPWWFTSGGIFNRGESIVFTSNRDGNNEIYIMAVDGSDQFRLTNHPGDDSLPSSRGSQIAFTTNRDGNVEIYLMGLDGSNPRNLSNNPAADQYPRWSRDNAWVAFITDRDGNGEIYIIRPDGSQFFNITNNPADEIVPAWR